MRKLQSLIKSFFPLAILALLAGCQVQDIDIKTTEEQNRELREVTITADIGEGAESIDPATRTTVIFEGTKLKTHWTPGDRIKVFSLGESTMFTSTNSEPSRKAQFRGTVSMIVGDDGESGINYLWGLYPYREDATYSEPDGEGQSATAVITTTVPDLQRGKADSFNNDIATMIGRSESLTISYKNAYSGVYVRFNKEDVISVTLKGLHGETLAGKATFGLDTDMNPVVVGEVQNPKTAVTVYAPDGGTFEAGKNYFMVTLPDVALEEGYSLTVKRQGGVEATFKSLTTVKSLDRNVFKTFNNPLDTYIENANNISNGRSTGWISSTTTSTQGINEIWYTTTDNTAVSYRLDATTGNEIAENIAPSDNNGVGIIRFNAPLTVIDPTAFMFNRNTILKTVSLPETVETIGHDAFRFCENLDNISFGSSLKTIENYAFSSCAFTEMILPEGLESLGSRAFEENPNLERITLPESLNSIGSATFNRCPRLKEFLGAHASSDHRCLIQDDDPDNVTILDFATGEMGQSDTYIISEGIHTIGTYAFASSTFGGIVLPESLREIKGAAFFNCSSLKNVTIPAAVESIQNAAFLMCGSLEWIKIKKVDKVISTSWESERGVFDETGDCPIYVPSNLLNYYKGSQFWDEYESRYVPIPYDNEIYYKTSDGEAVTYSVDSSTGNTLLASGCKAPKDNNGIGVIQFAAPVTEIDEMAFNGQSTLTLVFLPEGVETINDQAFQGCSNLTTVKIPSSITTLGKNPFVDCSSLTSFTGNNNLISSDGLALITPSGELVSYAIAATTGEYRVPEGVVTIGWDAMQKAAFSKVILPSTLQTIGRGAFRFSDLTEITLPASVTSIGAVAFAYCTSLTKMRIESETAPTLVATAFAGAPDDLVIWVPGLSATGYNDQTIAQPTWYAMINHIAYYQTDKEIWINNEGNTISFSGIDIHGIGDFYDAFSIVANDSHSNIDPAVDLPGSIGAAVIMVLCYHTAPTAIPASGFVETAAERRSVYVSLPRTITSIGNNAFDGCSILTVLPVSEDTPLRIIGEYAFRNCSNLSTVNLPEATSLGSHAFFDCSNLSSLSIPKVTTLGDRCLNRHSLKVISLPSITSIGAGALGRGSDLLYVSIGANITDMTNPLFSYPTSSTSQRHALRQLFMAAPVPPAINTSTTEGTFTGITFTNADGCIVVPSESAKAKYVARWGLPERMFSVQQ